MNKKTLLTTLAVVGLAAAVQAVPVSFSFQENGSNLALGSSSTFTEGGISITAHASAGDSLYAKLGSGETGLGLLAGKDFEITPGHFIQLGLPTSPISSLTLVFLSSVQAGETATIYYSTVLGSLGSLVGTVTSDTSFDVSAYSTGFIGISAGTGNVLLESLTAEVRTAPDGASTIMLLGAALTTAGMIRRKLVA